MPIDIGNTFNRIVDSLLELPVTNTIAHSPVYTAALITLVLFVIIVVAFSQFSEPVAPTAARASFWVFLLTTAIMFAHNRAYKQELLAASRESEAVRSISGTYDSLDSENIVPVVINTDFSRFVDK